MQRSDHAKLLDLAREGARRAGELIRQRLVSVKTIESKTNARDLVTDVDRDIESRLRAFFEKETPEFGWLGEETSFREKNVPEAPETSPNESETPRWVVDPIDGTTNFANGVPFCCVSIALCIGSTEALIGVVHDPFRGELFEGVTAEGARLNGTPLAVQRQRDLGQALLATGFPDTGVGPTANVRYMQRLMPHVGKVRAFGSAALELAYVAAGRLTGFWELHLSPWDTAAGVLMVREAGGIVTDLAGTRHHLFSGSILASSGHHHAELLRLLAQQ